MKKQDSWLSLIILLALVLVLISFLPVWKCGMRSRLTWWEWAKEHTVFGHRVEYIPEEDYEEALR